VNDQDLARFLAQKENGVPVDQRQLKYTTPQGAKVVITLYGFGTLRGSTVDSSGVLDLVYDNTTAGSRLTAHVVGGPGFAPIRSIRDADVPPRSPQVTGSDPIGGINFRDFRLIDGGYVNLTGGVGFIRLFTIGRGVTMEIDDLPPQEADDEATSNTLQFDIELQETIPTDPAATTQIVTAVFTPSAEEDVPSITGVNILVQRVEAGPLPQRPPLGPAQVFVVDTAANDLVRFEVATGMPTLTVDLPALQTTRPTLGVARNRGRQVVLVGDSGAARVYAFNVVTGAFEGSFTTSNLAGLGFTALDGIAGTDTQTVFVDALGPAVRIDLTSSLIAGQAVPLGMAFTPDREFQLTGGASGIAGTELIFASGAAHFDTFQPNLNQFGVLAMRTVGGELNEVNREAYPGFIDAGPTGMLNPNPFTGFGSIDGSLAQLTGVTAGKNVISLLDPSTLAPEGTILLNTAAPLAGLTESFHPELVNASVINVLGVLKLFQARRTRGLVLNTLGVLDTVNIHLAVDTAVVGRPITHVGIPNRQNVLLLSTARGTDGNDTTGGVIIDKDMRPVGPIALPEL
jgi:hypothetical protein